MCCCLYKQTFSSCKLSIIHPQNYLLAPEMETSGAAITAYEIATFPTSVARIMVVTFTRPLIVWVLGFLRFLHIQILVGWLYQRTDELKDIRKPP